MIKEQGFPIELPGKLKSSLEYYYGESDLVRYNIMLFMTLFNCIGNDIQPTTDFTFGLSSLMLFVGFLIVSNLIGEFSNLLNDIYVSDTNNEIDESRDIVEQI